MTTRRVGTRRVGTRRVEEEIANVGVPRQNHEAPPQAQALLGLQVRSILRSCRMEI